MEETIFLEQAVASLMKQHLVEARLHTDSPKHLTAEQFANNRAAQAELAGVKTNPYFVMVDPATGDKVGEFALSGGFGVWPSKWTEFLQRMIRKTGRG